MSKNTPPNPIDPQEAFDQEIDLLTGLDRSDPGRPANQDELVEQVAAYIDVHNPFNDPHTDMTRFEDQARYLHHIRSRLSTPNDTVTLGSLQLQTDPIPTSGGRTRPGKPEPLNVSGTTLGILDEYRELDSHGLSGNERDDIQPIGRVLVASRAGTAPLTDAEKVHDELAQDTYANKLVDDINGGVVEVQNLDVVHAKARRSAEYYAAATDAAAAAQQEARSRAAGRHNYATAPATPPTPPTPPATPVESLRDKLDVPVVRTPDRKAPPAPPSRELTDQEKLEFKQLMTDITKAGSDRHLLQARDSKSGNLTKYADIYWNGEAPHNGHPGTPSQLDILANRLAARLDNNSNYMALLIEHRNALGAAATSSGDKTTAYANGALANTRDASLVADANLRQGLPGAEHPFQKPVKPEAPVTPDYASMPAADVPAARARFAAEMNKYLGDMVQYSRKQAQYKTAQKEYESWWQNTTVRGHHIPGLKTMNAHGKKRQKLLHDVGETNKANNARDELPILVARATINLAAAQEGHQNLQKIQDEGTVRYETLNDVLVAAEARMGRAGFEAAHGSFDDLQQQVQDAQHAAIGNTLTTGNLSDEDDHAQYAGLWELHDYIATLDAELAGIDPDARKLSYTELHALRDHAAGISNGAHYRWLQLREMTIANERGDNTQGFKGTYPASYISDKGIRRHDGIVLYEDGTLRDPRLGTADRRHFDGGTNLPVHAPNNLPMVALDTTGITAGQLDGYMQSHIQNWFIFQARNQDLAYTVRQYAHGVIDLANQELFTDPDNDDLKTMRNRAGYWLNYVDLRPGEDARAVSGYGLTPDGALVGSHLYDSLSTPKDWARRPDGSADELGRDASGRTIIVSRRDPAGQPL